MQRRRVNCGARRRGHGVPSLTWAHDGREKVGRNELRHFKRRERGQTAEDGVREFRLTHLAEKF
jgi:hypothetical protein